MGSIVALLPLDSSARRVLNLLGFTLTSEESLTGLGVLPGLGGKVYDRAAPAGSGRSLALADAVLSMSMRALEEASPSEALPTQPG